MKYNVFAKDNVLHSHFSVSIYRITADVKCLENKNVFTSFYT